MSWEPLNLKTYTPWWQQSKNSDIPPSTSRNCEFKIILVNTLSLIKLNFSLVYMVDIVQWFVDRSEQIIITAVGVIVAWIIYKLVKRQINKYYKKEEDKEEQGEQIKKVVKAFYVIALIAIIFSQFSQSLGNIF